MHYSVPGRLAKQLYHSGHALHQQGRYVEALTDLQHAEVAFRKHDARGHPFSHPLPNGISGLANALLLMASCYQKLGDYKAAVTCYETSLINSKFEKKKAAGPLRKKLIEEISFSYEKLVEEVELPERERLLKAVPALDLSFRFPYSLPPCLIPVARLYELAPERYRLYRGFYDLARNTDARARRESKGSDDLVMRRIGWYAWGIISAIWLMYALIILRIVSK